jgi:hypothetical protein
MQLKEIKMAKRYAVGDKVILTRKECVQHFVPVGMTIRGSIARVRSEGYHDRLYGILFEDGRSAWYAAWEFKRR